MEHQEQSNRSYALDGDEINASGTAAESFRRAMVTLEFDKVLEEISKRCAVEGGAQLARSLTPSIDPERVRRALRETEEAMNLVTKKGPMSFGGIQNILPHLARAQKGASLSMGELLQVAAVLRTARTGKEYFASSFNESERRNLDDYADRLQPNSYLEEAITGAILADDNMADKASDALYDIRRKMRAATSKVRDVLQKYVTGAEGGNFLQERIITMRNGRYVIPVKSEYRSEVKGLVHDSSASGATVFIEPMSVVEANNELRMLEMKEKAEIERILAELSLECERFAVQLETDYSVLCTLSVLFAKAEYAFAIRGMVPEISDTPVIELHRARHPLLDSKTVVPIDIAIGGDYQMLVVTGPNTGGKTVTLKTLGLFALMAQSGIPIPASDGSKLFVFDSVFTDIGDEQSIEQSLSTFSSHMVNIVDILSRLRPASLALFDELGAGTDPVEGAALAEAILERVREIGCLCAATTHYAELKAFALQTKGVTNASSEFDLETLKPTYRLTIGLPGRSNAFAIARRLGMPEEVIASASGKIAGETRRFEELIDQLEQTKSVLDAERHKATAARQESEQLREQARQMRESFQKKVEQEADKAEKQARKLIESARAASDYVFEELERIKKQKDAEQFAQELAKAKQDVRSQLSQISDRLTPVIEKVYEDERPVRDLRAGDRVLFRDIGKEGTVLKIDGENAEVQAGIIKTRTKLSNLLLIGEQNKLEKQKKQFHAGMSTTMSIRPEIDVRGFTCDDAWFMVDKYLDDASMANLEKVTVIHGKGTGALRAGLWKYFKSDPRIDSFRAGAYGEGDAGVTIVTLK